MQWFLEKYARVPKPDSSNVSYDHLSCGISWPSLIPCPITLPGRIMSNAKYHIEQRNKENAKAKQSFLAKGVNDFCEGVFTLVVACISVVQLALTVALALALALVAAAALIVPVSVFAIKQAPIELRGFFYKGKNNAPDANKETQNLLLEQGAKI